MKPHGWWQERKSIAPRFEVVLSLSWYPSGWGFLRQLSQFRTVNGVWGLREQGRSKVVLGKERAGCGQAGESCVPRGCVLAARADWCHCSPVVARSSPSILHPKGVWVKKEQRGPGLVEGSGLDPHSHPCLVCIFCLALAAQGKLWPAASAPGPGQAATPAGSADMTNRRWQLPVHPNADISAAAEGTSPPFPSSRSSFKCVLLSWLWQLREQVQMREQADN